MTSTSPSPTTTPTRLIVPTGGRSTTVVEIGAHGLNLGEQQVRFDAIESIAYSTRSERANLVQRRMRRIVWMRAGDTVIQLRLGEQAFGQQHEEVQALAYATLVRALHGNVEPRIRASTVGRVRAGETVAIGPIVVERTGFRVITRPGSPAIERAWRNAPMAELFGHEITLTEGRDGPVVARIDADTPDAVLLPELLLSCAAAFT